MSEAQEQHVCIKFCVKLRRNGAETFEMLRTAFGEQCLSRARIFEWHKRFKEGRDSVDDSPRSGSPTRSKTDGCVARVRELIRANRHLIHELSVEVGASYGTCQAVLTQDLNMRRVAAKFVPRILTAKQKEWLLSVATNMLQEAESDENFMWQIITGDETWVYGYDRETKHQSSQWKSADSPGPKKARQVRSKVKVMLIVFFDMEGIVHYEYVPQGQTVNQWFYIQVLKRLASHGIPVDQQPPYSPDMAPCDFWLFSQLKAVLKGKRFEDIDAIKKNATSTLNTIPKDSFQKCFQQWQDRWKQCDSSQGEYFEHY